MLLKKLNEAKYMRSRVVWRIGGVIWRRERTLAKFGSVWRAMAEWVFVGGKRWIA
jgi:hypothetical protein